MKKEDYFKYYIQGSDHYLIPKDVFDELFDEMENWKEESKELKQKYENAVADYETTMAEKKEMENQQKDVIEYLEDKLCIADEVLDELEEDEEVRGYVLARKFMLEEILSKYKEIIGGKDE